MKKRFLAFLSLIFLSACSNRTKISPWDRPVHYNNSEYNQTIQIKYMGAAGFLIKKGDSGVLTAPFFSNFSIPELALPISPRIDVIDRLYPDITDEEVKGILVGHSHYDHLIDLPYIAEKYHKSSKIYCSKTAESLLLSVDEYRPDKNRLVDVTGDMEIPMRSKGTWLWIEENKIKILPIKSSHSSHIFGIKFYNGKLYKPLREAPKYAHDWVEGQTIAYFIDFVENGETIYRVYFQDAASEAPMGLPFDDGVKVDTAILCVGGFTEAENYPDYIVKNLKPDNVILGHWEDFFSPQTDNIKDIMNTKAIHKETTGLFNKALKKSYPQANRITPMPGRTYNFKIKKK